ncbi:MAG: hypothetical protein QM692_01415 [Thermomicrobiales bacterium]
MSTVPSQWERCAQSLSFVQQSVSGETQVEPTLSWQHLEFGSEQHKFQQVVQLLQTPLMHCSPGAQQASSQTICPVGQQRSSP